MEMESFKGGKESFWSRELILGKGRMALRKKTAFWRSDETLWRRELLLG